MSMTMPQSKNGSILKAQQFFSSISSLGFYILSSLILPIIGSLNLIIQGNPMLLTVSKDPLPKHLINMAK